MSARSNGSVRRLNSFGTRSTVNGSAQIPSVPCWRCSMNTIFQFSNRIPSTSASSEKYMNPRRGECSTWPVRYGSRFHPSMCTRKFFSPAWWPVLSFSTMSGSPAAAQERREPVVVLDDVVGDRAGGDVTGPADHLGHAEGTLPVGVLLAAERGGRSVGPGVGVRAVVGGVDDDRVVGEAELVEQVEQLTRRCGRGRSSCRGRATARSRPAPGSPAWCGSGDACGSCSSSRRTGSRPRAACGSTRRTRAVVSSSIVSMRFLVSGPVSSIRCLPTRPYFSSTVSSSSSVAQQCRTPRGNWMSCRRGYCSLPGKSGSSGSSSALRW